MKKKSSFTKIFFIVFFLINLSIVAGGFYISHLFSAVDRTATTDTQFVIPKGQSITKIGERLEEANLIRNSFIFKILVRKEGLEDQIQAGSFKLSPNMSLTQIATELTTGTEDEWITIQEGWRVEEIADSIERQGFEFFDKEEFIALAKDDEGRLFPDTYLVPQQLTAPQLYTILTTTFNKKIKEIEQDINISSRSFDEVLIMASIVEREGRGYTDLQYIAGILWNRIEIGMPLQADATLQYANGYSEVYQTWWREPTAQDKEIVSPYNTYQNPGLPPGPITNPGLDALKATLNPIESNYLYYIHDTNGVGHYATTYEEHLKNINKYLR